LELGKAVACAAAAIREAEVLIVAAGAGMGVDSGLPDFRGPQGFWKAYPMYERLGMRFEQAANPSHFTDDPAFGWGFYGHRLELYRKTVPHDGFRILRDWVVRFGLDAFVVTSNVDGQFQKAGFDADAILEVHGSIHHLQCMTPCCDAIWTNAESVAVDPATMRARSIPRCPHCGGVARPNILMFGDWSWVDGRTRKQEERFDRFLGEAAGRKTVVVEMGAGTDIATIRCMTERLGRSPGITAVRINPREPGISPPHLPIAQEALKALSAIDALLPAQGSR
jgi:NAD-dependent SIR2 family protein deacetylase